MVITGKVKWFDTKKGYGFIAANDGQGDVFLHYGDFADKNWQSVEPGQVLRFEIGEMPHGRRALRVRFLLDSESPADGRQVS